MGTVPELGGRRKRTVEWWGDEPNGGTYNVEQKRGNTRRFDVRGRVELLKDVWTDDLKFFQHQYVW